MQLMRQRQDIEDLLQDGDTDPELVRRLELTRDIRAFAVDQLGLRESDSYTQYAETGREAVSWNVVATPEFTLTPKTWCFLVAGCVPYRGYFKQESARKFAEKLADKSYDVAVSPAAAYSTLGWFNDPLLDTMFRYDNARLAGLVFHEMAHQQLYVRGDAAFNEAFASVVEEFGIRSWLESRGESGQLDSWKNSREVSREFNVFLADHRSQLKQLYDSDLEEVKMREQKRKALDRLRSEYQDLVTERWGGSDYFSDWFSSDLNNAKLAMINTYQGGSCAFEMLYNSAGENMPRFLERAAEKAKLDRDRRAAWLNQSCSSIAPTDNL